MKKLLLNDLKVDSFRTSLNQEESKTILGGANPVNVSYSHPHGTYFYDTINQRLEGRPASREIMCGGWGTAISRDGEKGCDRLNQFFGGMTLIISVDRKKGCEVHSIDGEFGCQF